MVKKTESNELRGNWLKKNVPSDLLSAAEIENYKSRKELAQSFTPKDISRFAVEDFQLHVFFP